jgi:two-component SAPR family response regulator
LRASENAKAVMVLDDEGDIVFIIRETLKLARYSVFAFTDPELALEHLKNNVERYGLIISDVRMPKMNGIEFVEKVRTFAPNISIILMSAFSMAELDIRPELRIAELLEKPITSIKLRETVVKHIKLTSTA